MVSCKTPKRKGEVDLAFVNGCFITFKEGGLDVLNYNSTLSISKVLDKRHWILDDKVEFTFIRSFTTF